MKRGPLAELDMVDQSAVRTLVTKARGCLTAAKGRYASLPSTGSSEGVVSATAAGQRSSDSRTSARGVHEARGSGRLPMSDLVLTKQFIEQATPEALRAELLRHIDEGVRAIHISLTLPLREPVRCIARRDS
jgi:hypothetical protein